MRFLVLSDIHGDITGIDNLDGEFADVDAVLYAGDFARFDANTSYEPTETGMPVLNKLLEKHETLFAVTGNCDNPLFKDVLEEKDVSVEGILVYFNPFFICGSGGALKFTGITANEKNEEDLVNDLHTICDGTLEDSDWNNLILIIHQPPKDTKLDVISSGVHVGSQLVRKFIEDVQPFLVITGHIHESFGIDTIGNTTIINPGALCDGRYALIDAEQQDGQWKIISTEMKKL